LEDFAVLEVCNRSVHEFANYLKGLGADLSRRNYVFIDEIQYLDDPTHFLKFIFDELPAIKLFVTGSSTLEIRQKFKDSLAGRKIVVELMPLDFAEFLLFRGEPKLAELVEQFSLRQIVARGRIDDFPLRPFQEIHFWRTQSQNEVDFVLHQNELLPIEVKFRPFAAVAPPAGLRSFTQEYPCRHAVILTQDGVEMTKTKKLSTFFLPVWAA
jgi:predicted AAA+ superfamily ATPase